MLKTTITKILLKNISFLIFLFPLVISSPISVHAQGFLKVEGKSIVDEKGSQIVLRGMGLGGWMLQEGYMLKVPNKGQQHYIKSRIEEVIGKEKTREFYQAWLSNHTRKIDIDSMKAWGFNSVRLPIHYELYTLPVEKETVKGKQTWLKKGFEMTDSLLNWCKANNLYLILDLHAAPGGQGNDVNISDRDESKPSLWESKENQKKTIELWRKLAERYRNEPNIAAYDILNEPNWGFVDPKDRNGLNEPKNEPLKNLMMDITSAIREVDKEHIIIIEGNGWGNNYNGILPPWDENMVLSFHKYWNYNDEESIKKHLELRNKHNIPLWLGETGENSNLWFTEAIRLAESNEIGWSWWPLKKIGFNNPLEIKMPHGYQELLDYWAGKGTKPSADAAYKSLMQLAENTKLENCIYHKDVVDAMFRQVRSEEAIPFSNHRINKPIFFVDFDLGRSGVAYHDNDTADYHISLGTGFNGWNLGRVYRNDGVDITECKDSLTNGYAVKAESGEWLQYTITIPKDTNHSLKLRASAENSGKVTIMVNGNKIVPTLTIENTGGFEHYKNFEIKKASFKKGTNKIRILTDGNVNLNYLIISDIK